MSDYWYKNQDRLCPGHVCELEDTSVVRLFERVPGDGTDWIVEEWSSGWGDFYKPDWYHGGRRIHPSDIKKGPQWWQ